MPQTDLLIIGAGPAGWSCALTARQRDLSVTVVAVDAEQGWLVRAHRIDNYPGMPGVSGKELLSCFRQQALDAGATLLSGVARQVSPLGDRFMTLVGNEIVESSAVVLTVGTARPTTLPGEDELLGQGVSWCGTCDGMFYRGKEVAVLSAYHGGVEEAEFLSKLASKVDYYTMNAHALPENPPFALRDGKPKSLARSADQRIILTTDQGESVYDGIFIFRPAVSPAKMIPGLALEDGFVAVDRRMQTNLPRLYAAGDCTGHPLQVAKAVGEGNIAAISAAEDLQRRSSKSPK